MLGKLFSRSSPSHRRSRRGLSAGGEGEMGANDDYHIKAKIGRNGHNRSKTRDNRRARDDEMPVEYDNETYTTDQDDHYQDIRTKNLLYGTLNKSNMPLLNSDNDIRVLILQNKDNSNQFLFDSLRFTADNLPEGGAAVNGQFDSVLSHQDIKSVVFGTSLQSKLMGTQTKYYCITDASGNITKVIVAKVFKLMPAPPSVSSTNSAQPTGDLSYIQINNASSLKLNNNNVTLNNNTSMGSSIIWKQESTVDVDISNTFDNLIASNTATKATTPLSSNGSSNCHSDNSILPVAHIAIGIAIVIHLPPNDPNVILNHWKEFSSCLIDLQSAVYQKLSSYLVVKPTPSGLSSLLSTSSPTRSRGRPERLNLNISSLDHDEAILAAVELFKHRFVASIKIPRILCGQNNWIELYDQLNWAYHEFEKNPISLGFLSVLLTTFIENDPDLVLNCYSLNEGDPSMKPENPTFSAKSSNRPLRSRTLIVSDDKFIARKLSYILTSMIPSTINDKLNQWDQQNQKHAQDGNGKQNQTQNQNQNQHQNQRQNQYQKSIVASPRINRQRSISPSMLSYHAELSRFGRAQFYQASQKQFEFSPREDSYDGDSMVDEECKNLATSLSNLATSSNISSSMTAVGWEIPKRSMVSKTCESLIHALPQVIRPSMSSFSRSGSSGGNNSDYHNRHTPSLSTSTSMSISMSSTSSVSAASFNSAKAINIHHGYSMATITNAPSSLTNSFKFSSSLTNSFKRSVVSGSGSSSSISSLWSNIFSSGMSNNGSTNGSLPKHIDTLSSRDDSNDDKFNWGDYYDDLLPYNNGFAISVPTIIDTDTDTDTMNVDPITTKTPSMTDQTPTATVTAISTATTNASTTPISYAVKGTKNIQNLSLILPTRPKWNRTNSSERTPTTVYPCSSYSKLGVFEIDQGGSVGNMAGYFNKGVSHMRMNSSDGYINNKGGVNSFDEGNAIVGLVTSPPPLTSTSLSSLPSSPLSSSSLSSSLFSPSTPNILNTATTAMAPNMRPGFGINTKDLDIKLTVAPGYSILDIPFVPPGDSLTSSILPSLEKRSKSLTSMNNNNNNGQASTVPANMLNVGSYSSRNPNFHHRHIGLAKQYGNNVGGGGSSSGPQRASVSPSPSPSQSRSASPSPSTSSFNNNNNNNNNNDNNNVYEERRRRSYTITSDTRTARSCGPPLSSMNPIVLPPIVGFIGEEFHPDFYLQSISSSKRDKGHDAGPGNSDEDDNNEKNENDNDNNNNEIDQKVIKLLLKESELVMNANRVTASKVTTLRHMINHEGSRGKNARDIRNLRRLRRMGTVAPNTINNKNNHVQDDNDNNNNKSLQVPTSIEAREFNEFEQQVKQQTMLEESTPQELNRLLVIDLNNRHIYYWVIVAQRVQHDNDDYGTSSDEVEPREGKGLTGGEDGYNNKSEAASSPLFQIKIYKHNVYQHGKLNDDTKVHKPELVGVRWALRSILHGLEDSDSEDEGAGDDNETPRESCYSRDKANDADSDIAVDVNVDSDMDSNGTERDPRMIKKLFENLIKLARPCPSRPIK